MRIENYYNIVNKEKRPYEAPALTAVTFKMEKGYLASIEFLSHDLFLDNEQVHGDNCESRENGGSWGGSENWVN